MTPVAPDTRAAEADTVASQVPTSPKSNLWAVALVLGMIVVPAALTLHTIHVPAVVDVSKPNPSPYGYTVSLLLFVVPIVAIGCWLVPQDQVKISKRAFLWTLGLLFPVGAGLDFFFAHLFFKFPNPAATLGIPAPALGACEKCHIFVGTPDHIIVGSVPIEEYAFYLTGFAFILLLYIWLDEYWLDAYSVPDDAAERAEFQRLVHFHVQSFLVGVGLIVAGVVFRQIYDLRHPGAHGFPGYFTFLSLAASIPASLFFRAVLPVINWRALALVLFVILLTSLLWEATLGVPYGWWDYQHSQMLGIFITAWNFLPIEAVCLWIAVTFQTVIVYEVIKRWKASGRRAMHAFLAR